MAKHIPMYVSQLDPSFTSFKAEEVDAKDIALSAMPMIDAHLKGTRKFRSEGNRQIEAERMSACLEVFVHRIITGGPDLLATIQKAATEYSDGLNTAVPVLTTDTKLGEQPDVALTD